jgi:hypothetical protein
VTQQDRPAGSPVTARPPAGPATTTAAGGSGRRGTATAWLVDGPHAGAFVQVEAVDGVPSRIVYFAAVDGRVLPMPRGDVTAATLNEAAGRWRPYGCDSDEPTDETWRYRLLPAAARPVAER